MRVFLMLMLLAPLGATAGVSGVYQLSSGQNMELSYKDSDHMRMSMPGGHFMLVNGDKVFMVRKQGGQWIAMNMAEMGKMMQDKGMKAQKNKQVQQAADQVTLKKTGRTETVAGYKGTVYRVTDGQGHTDEVVFSQHEDIVKLSRGWVEFSSRMASSMGMMNDEMQDILDQQDIDERGGMLRVGDDMRLESVSTGTKGSEFYQLPEGTRVQRMPTGLGQRR